MAIVLALCYDENNEAGLHRNQREGVRNMKTNKNKNIRHRRNDLPALWGVTLQPVSRWQPGAGTVDAPLTAAGFSLGVKFSKET